MNIRQLRVFHTVCQEMSVTRAAQRLYISQPAVSQAVAELESELGIALFDRVSRRIYLTEAGRMFLQRVRRVLTLYDELEQCGGDLERRAPLRVASSITLATELLPGAIRRFEERFPDARVQVRVDNAQAVVSLLSRGEADLALVEGIVRKDCFVSVPLAPYELAVVRSPSYRFRYGPQIPDVVCAQDLVREKLLLRERGSAVRDTFDSALTLARVSADPVWVSVNSSALLRAAQAGLGIAVVPASLAAEALRRGSVVPVRVEGLSLSCPNQLLYFREKTANQTFARFAELLREPPETP